MEYVTTSKGKPAMVYRNQEYLVHKIKPDSTTVWRCRRHKALKCKAMMWTRHDDITREPSNHNHVANPVQTEVTKALEKMKGTACTRGTSTRVAIAAAMEEVNQTVMHSMPKKTTMERRIRSIRARNKETDQENGNEEILLYDGREVEDEPNILDHHLDCIAPLPQVELT